MDDAARYSAETTSRRCDVSSPRTRIAARQHGQAVSSGAIITSTRADEAAATARHFTRAAFSVSVLFLLLGLSRHQRLLDVLKGEWSWSGSSFSELRPN